MPALGGLLEKAFSRPAVAFSGSHGQISHSEHSISGAGALRVAAVWIATTVLADEVASMASRLIERDDDKRVPRRPREFAPLWDKPNRDQTLFGWKAATTLSMVLHGVSYTKPSWTNGMNLEDMWPLNPDDCTLRRHPSGGLELDVAGKQPLVNLPGAVPEFMMIPLYQLPGVLEPVSPVKMAASLLGLSQEYDRTAQKFARRGFNPSAVLTSEEFMETEDAEKLSSRLDRLHGGSAGGGVAVLGGKDLKLQAWTMTMADAEFIAQRHDVFNTLLAIWRVPATVAGMVDKPSTWGTGVAEFSRGLERFTLRPLVKRLEAGVEDAITKFGTPPLQWRFKFESLLAASPTEQAQVDRTALLSGMTSVERILARHDEEPFREGETVYNELALATEADRELQRLQRRAAAYNSLVRAGVTADAAAVATGFDPASLPTTGIPVTNIPQSS